MPSLEKYILKIHRKLSSEGIEESKIMKYFKELDRLQITLDTLKVSHEGRTISNLVESSGDTLLKKATGIGKLVNRFRKHNCYEVGELASLLVTKWKELLKQESNDNLNSPSKLSPKEIAVLNRNHIQREDNECSPSTSEWEQQYQSQPAETHYKKSKPSKPKVPSLQLCDVSFGCEPVNKKPKKRPVTSTSAASTNMTCSESLRVESELPPLPSASFVSNSLLPDIQPTYKPIRYPDFGDSSPNKKKKGIVGGELDEHALMSRKSRTQVFSGRRLASSGRVHIMSLFDLSMEVLVENIDALHDTGGVPYDILAPLLAKCTPQQLMHLEECNPYFMDDTEPLWEIHCKRDLKGDCPKPSQKWRDFYLRTLSEREDRLKKLSEKISAAQAAKKPERQLQLAYVKTEAKPPRDVLRKQAKFGTGKGLHNDVYQPGLSRSAPHPVQHRTVGPSVQKKQTVPAPMMKKTMKLFKNQRNRASASIKRT